MSYKAPASFGRTVVALVWFSGGALVSYFARMWFAYILLFCLRGNADSMVDSYDRLVSSMSTLSIAVSILIGGLISVLIYWLFFKACNPWRAILLPTAASCALGLSNYQFRLVSVPFFLFAMAFLIAFTLNKEGFAIAAILLFIFVIVCFSPIDLSMMKLKDPAGFQSMDYLKNGRGPFAPYVWTW